MTKTAIVVEAVPGPIIPVAGLENLARTLASLRATHGIDLRAPVDVLVAPDVDMQRLVDVIVALDGAGVHEIGLGNMPDTRALGLRGHHIPNTFVSHIPNPDNPYWFELPTTSQARINRCYAAALVKDPKLAAVASVKAFIEADGAVTATRASGVDHSLASCIEDAFRSSAFPDARHYRSAGGWHAYEVTFRPD